MKDKIIKMLPEIDSIKNQGLRNAVINTLEDAILMGGWEPEDMAKIPFTVHMAKVPKPVSYIDHVRAITVMCQLMYEQHMAFYCKDGDKRYMMDHDAIIAGAILHDVGKFLEIGRNANGNYITTEYGKLLRHPISGAIIAAKNGVSPEVVHIIGLHSIEGDSDSRGAVQGLRSPEALVVYHADMMNFETIKWFVLNEMKNHSHN
jgi:hypothetical protein